MITISSSYTQRYYNWSDWKTYQLSRSLNCQFQEDDYMYYIWGYNASDCFITQIWKDIVPYGIIQGGYNQDQNDSDKSDFETNYKSSGNSKLIDEVTTQFEKRDKTLKLVHAEGDVTGDGTVTILLKVPGTPGSTDGRWISSGTAFFDIHTPGDKVLAVRFTDEDNILGYGIGYTVGSYTDDDADEINQGWAIPPVGWIKAETIGGYGFAPSGLYIKVIATKAGDSPSGKFYCNIEWAKIE